MKKKREVVLTGRDLRQIRLQCNISKSQLGELLNVSRQMVNYWESGKKNITEARWCQILGIVGLPLSYIYEGNLTESIVGKPQYRYRTEEREVYLFCQGEEDEVFFFNKREKTLDEEYSFFVQSIDKMLALYALYLKGNDMSSLAEKVSTCKERIAQAKVSTK